jgi:hypothetical protein
MAIGKLTKYINPGPDFRNNTERVLTYDQRDKVNPFFKLIFPITYQLAEYLPETGIHSVSRMNQNIRQNGGINNLSLYTLNKFNIPLIKRVVRISPYDQGIAGAGYYGSMIGFDYTLKIPELSPDRYLLTFSAGILEKIGDDGLLDPSSRIMLFKTLMQGANILNGTESVGLSISEDQSDYTFFPEDLMMATEEFVQNSSSFEIYSALFAKAGNSLQS